jgi:hypothetical protein
MINIENPYDPQNSGRVVRERNDCPVWLFYGHWLVRLKY